MTLRRKTSIVSTALALASLFTTACGGPNYDDFEATDFEAAARYCENLERFQNSLKTTSGDDVDFTTEDCFVSAIIGGKEYEAHVLQEQLRQNGISEEDLQALKNQALIESAKYDPRKDNLDLALTLGANKYIQDIDGRRIGQIILERNAMSDPAGAPLSLWPLVEYLNEEHRYGLLFTDNREIVWNILANASTESLQQHGPGFLAFLVENDIPLEEIREITSDRNILHLAAKKEAPAIFEYLDEQGIQLTPYDARGYHVLDYADDDTKDLLRSYFDTAPLPLPNDSLPQRYLLHYLNDNGAPLYNIDYSQLNKGYDFSMYSPIEWDEENIGDNNLDPVLIVAEYAGDQFSQHILHTSRTARGTSIALGDSLHRNDDVITIQQNPLQNTTNSRIHGNPQQNNLSKSLFYNIDDYVIVTHSIAESLFFAQDIEYQTMRSLYMPTIDFLDQTNFIYYNSAGNSSINECISVDGKDFCLQNASESYHHIQTVRVGAAHARANGNFSIPDYSEMNPTFCAALPGINGTVYAGTSFSSPAAAAVENYLADIYARSVDFPEGVIHEDILMALILTAHKDNITDELTDSVVPTYRNESGIEMSNRCGAGVIDPQAASDLLTDMIEWTRNDSDVSPSVAQTQRILLNTDQFTIDNQYYRYTMTVPESGILTQIRAGLVFEQDHKGAALMKIGTHDPVVLDLSSSGLTTEFRFAGYEFEAGETVEIITTRPLQSPGTRDRFQNFIDLRTIRPESPVGKALEQNRAPAPDIS